MGKLTVEEIEQIEKANFQLKALHEELSVLVKKSPKDTVNGFKLKLINKVLADSNKVLGDKYKPFDDFILFEESEIPSNSDITFILSQYIGSMNNIILDCSYVNLGKRYWLEKNDLKIVVKSLVKTAV